MEIAKKFTKISCKLLDPEKLQGAELKSVFLLLNKIK